MLQVSTTTSKGKAMRKTADASTGREVRVEKEGNVTRKLPLSTLMRAARDRKNKTLDEMADITGLAKSTLWEMENDYQIDPRLSTLKRVCWAYGFGISRIDNHEITGD